MVSDMKMHAIWALIDRVNEADVIATMWWIASHGQARAMHF
jgi:hypothetical protein